MVRTRPGLALVSLNYFTLYLHRNLLSYIQPSLVAELGLSDTQLGLLQQAFLLPYCLAQIGVGYLSDRFRRRSVLVTSLTRRPTGYARWSRMLA